MSSPPTSYHHLRSGVEHSIGALVAVVVVVAVAADVAIISCEPPPHALEKRTIAFNSTAINFNEISHSIVFI